MITQNFHAVWLHLSSPVFFVVSITYLSLLIWFTFVETKLSAFFYVIKYASWYLKGASCFSNTFVMFFLYLVSVSQFLLTVSLDLFRRYHSHYQDHLTSRVKVLPITLKPKSKALSLLHWHLLNLFLRGFYLFCIS